MQKTTLIPQGHRVVSHVDNDGKKSVECSCGWIRTHSGAKKGEPVWHYAEITERNIIWLWFVGHIIEIIDYDIPVDYVYL